MPHRHHIYNFHIGFWNAFLISLVVIIQSALFLFVSSGISMAATQVAQVFPITINNPTEADPPYPARSTIDFNISTPQFSSGVTIHITDSSGNEVGPVIPPFLDFQNWLVSWPANANEGVFEIVVEAVDTVPAPDTQTYFSTPFSITIGQAPIQLTWDQPGDNTIIENPITFKAHTIDPVDDISFNMNPLFLGGHVLDLPGILDAQNIIGTYNFDPGVDPTTGDPAGVPEGDYELKAIATAGTQTAETIPITVTVQRTIPQPDITLTPPPTSISGQVILQATTTNAPPGSSVQFQFTESGALTAPNVVVTPNATEGTPGSWSLTFDSSTSTADPTAGVPNGDYSLNAQLTYPDPNAPGSNQIIASQTAPVTVDNAVQQQAGPALSLDTTQGALAGATLNQVYNATLDASGGVADATGMITYDWTVTDLALPAGLSLNPNTGVISGTPNTAGNYTFEVTVSDGASSQSGTFSITVVDPNAGDATLPSFTNPVSMPGLASPLPDAKEGDLYSQTLKCQGGATTDTTYSLSVNRPGWLTLESATSGKIIGTPPAGTIPGSANTITLEFTVHCQNGNDTATQLTSIKITRVDVPPPADEVPATLELSAPNAQVLNGVLIFKGNNVTINITANEAVAIPTMMLVQGGRNVIDQTAPPPSSSDATAQNWTYILDSNEYANGDYEFRAQARAKDDNEMAIATSLNVKINNPSLEEQAGQVFEGGTITSPRDDDGLSGIILLVANVFGGIKSVTFRVEPEFGVPIIIPAEQKSTTDKTRWEATWDSDGIQMGEVTLRADVIDKADNTYRLASVNFRIAFETIPVGWVPEPSATTDTTAQPTIEEVVGSDAVSNIGDDGMVSVIPFDCLRRGKTDPAECDEYLKSIGVTILDDQEQEKAKDDLAEIVTHLIKLGDGVAVSIDPTAKLGDAQPQKVVEDPLAKILPIDKTAAKDVIMLVLSSTEVPDNLKPFVEQTIPAVLVFDRDGDGLSDEAEIRLGTDPNNADSDGDGYTDGDEIKNGYNPLGEGRFGQVLAPVEKAILNNRPLDQPKFAGRIDNENINVSQVQTTVDPTMGDGKVLRLSGRAEPNSFVTLYIYSSLPIVISVKADASGNWEYDLTHPLVDGKHDVYATVTNDTGKIIKKSRALSFFVQSASAVTEEEFLQATIDIPDASGAFMIYYMLGGILIVLLGGGMFFYYIKQAKSFT